MKRIFAIAGIFAIVDFLLPLVLDTPAPRRKIQTNQVLLKYTIKGALKRYANTAVSFVGLPLQYYRSGSCV